MLSEDELRRLITQHGDNLLRVCLLYLKDYALAEDAVQETFLRAYRHFGSFEHRSSERTWLTAIAVNVCRNTLRSPWRKRETGEEPPEFLAADEETFPDSTVTRAVMRLPDSLRAVVTLYYMQGFKVREIAEMLHIPVATVSSRLSRARKKLQIELKEWYFDEESDF